MRVLTVFGFYNCSIFVVIMQTLLCFGVSVCLYVPIMALLLTSSVFVACPPNFLLERNIALICKSPRYQTLIKTLSWLYRIQCRKPWLGWFTDIRFWVTCLYYLSSHLSHQGPDASGEFWSNEQHLYCIHSKWFLDVYSLCQYTAWSYHHVYV